MKSKLFFWLVVFFTCYLFNYLAIPAAWLLGSLIVGICYRLFIGPFKMNRFLFPVALALIGLNLGHMLDIELLVKAINNFGFAIFFGVLAIIVSGLALGYILYKKTSLDLKTSIFSFIPGGASVVLGLAENQGTDIRIVAAFHSARMILFVSLIPLLVGTGIEGSTSISLSEDLFNIDATFIFLCIILFVALFLYRVAPLPAGPLLYATVLTIFLNFMVDLNVPLSVAGVGQMLIGASIGLRFDPISLKVLWKIKGIGSILLFFFIGSSIGISYIFSIWTHVDIWSSILGWIPAGAGEMSSTAILLNLDETSVITIQLIRLYAVFISLPVLIKWLNSRENKKG